MVMCGRRLVEKPARSHWSFLRLRSPSSCTVADLRCNLLWESDSSLVIGWYDTVMILNIKARPILPTGRISPGQPVRVGEIAVRWKADCVISGLYPFDMNSIALLGYVTIGGEELEDEEEPAQDKQDEVSDVAVRRTLRESIDADS